MYQIWGETRSLFCLFPHNFYYSNHFLVERGALSFEIMNLRKKGQTWAPPNCIIPS
jgi:hypothetical protein